MHFHKLMPSAGSPLLFDWMSIGRIPDTSGCYALSAHDGTVLYIGQAQDINSRIQQHLDSEEKRARTPWGKVQWVCYRLCSLTDLSQLEHTWTTQFKIANRGKLPYFNKIEPPQA